MEERQYRTELRKVLDENSTIVINKLNATLQTLPKKSKSIELMIFPDQDGEGTFDVRVSLSGPDLYVLNEKVKDSAGLINVKNTPTGLEPRIPLIDPFNSEFEVNDTLVDVVSDWLKSIWQQAETRNISLPVTILADEGYGRNLPIKLN